ncbi:ABC transporter permease [bacterium]|nr:ABC transporter permease [bacterium]
MPGTINRILLRLLHPAIRQWAMRDFEDRYFEVRSCKSALYGLLWLLGQMFMLIPNYCMRKWKGSCLMLNHELKSAWRSISGRKIFSILNWVGLATGMAGFFLIMMYVRFELSFDQYHDDINQLHRIGLEESFHSDNGGKSAWTQGPLAGALMESFPEVESAGHLLPLSSSGKRPVLRVEGRQFAEKNVFLANSRIFDIFNFQFIHGHPADLDDPAIIFLSKSEALKLFGSKDPLGKTIQINKKLDLKVAGIFEDVPVNSYFTPRVLISWDHARALIDLDLKGWGTLACHTFFKLRKGSDIRALELKFPDLLATYWAPQRAKEFSLFTQPLKKLHLHSRVNHELHPPGNYNTVMIFLLVAGLILGMACLNYIGLATAQAAQRAREVGIRKVSGASRVGLVLQFFNESLLMAFLSAAGAMMLVSLLTPGFSRLVARPLVFQPFTNAGQLLLFIVLTFIVGILSGAYPALVLSAFKPVTVLRGQFNRSASGLGLRNILVFFQFVISIALIAATLCVGDQLRFMRNKNLGYSKDQVLCIPVRGSNLRRQSGNIRSALAGIAHVLNISSSSALPNQILSRGHARWPGKPEDLDVEIYLNRVDDRFLDLYNIPLVEGRNFSDKYTSDRQGAYLLNESAVKTLGWKNPLEHEFSLWGRNPGPVVGVVKDFHFQSLHAPVKPLYMVYQPEDGGSMLSLKLHSGSIEAAMRDIHAVLNQFPSAFPWEPRFLDETFDAHYRDELRIEKIFKSMAVFAILIALLGLWGLTLFMAERRTREIGIRQVMGADTRQILWLLGQDVVRWFLLAVTVSLPMVYYFIEHWKIQFVSQAPAGWQPWIIATLSGGLIVSFTIIYHSLNIIKKDPVKSLRID